MLKFNTGDRILQTGALEFDASTFEIWGSLLNSMTLVLADKDDLLYTSTLKSLIKNSNISTMWMTSSYFNRMLDEDLTIFIPLKNLIIGGEALSLRHINKIRETYPELNLINGYGPTENVTFSTTLLIDKKYYSNIPIGKPIANSTAYIVDRNNSLVPIGASGELLVGGDGVSRGYLNNKVLTKEKFVPNIFTNKGFLYRTGDSARWLSDGNIEFLGRVDSQVKVRGYRIELSEIENQILKYNSIIESVVIDLEDAEGVKYLCAYYITDDKSENLNIELKDFISHFLPDYMIPAYFVKIEELPLTSNGKLDKKSLPAPNAKVSGNFTGPGNIIEEKLAIIWSDILGIESSLIGTSSNFFELGGHSLRAIKLISKIHKEFEVKIPLMDVFRNQNLNELSEVIQASSTVKYISIPKAEPKEYYPLSSAQKRLFVLQQMNLESTNYNMPLILTVENDLDPEKLEFTFNKIISRHESLRTSFHIINEEPVQKIDQNIGLKIEEISTDEDGYKKLSENFSIPFDLTNAPLLRVKLINVENVQKCLLIDMHHIITDGTSQDILQEEFDLIYNGEELVELTLQYTDYSEWQNSEEQQYEMKNQEKFWLEKFNDELPVLNLPYDFKRPEVQSFEGANVNFILNKRQTSNLKELCKKTDTTLYMALLSIYNILISKLSSEEDIIVGTPIQARRHVDLEKIIGMFVNTLAVRSNVSGSSYYLGYLKSLKSTVVQTFENQEYQFEDLVERLNISRDTGRNPVFDIVFNLLNQSEKNVEVDESDFNEYYHLRGTSKFDLNLTSYDYGENIFFNLEYCTSLFNKNTINRFIEYFKNIADLLSDDHDLQISEINMLGEELKSKLLYEFNSNKNVNYPKDKTIHQLFEEQVKRTPENIALKFGEDKLTYRELNEKSNQLAHKLRSLNVCSDEIVAVLLKRSLNTIITVLGILKSGGAYLSLDPDYPSKRNCYILNDGSVKILVTTNNLSKNIEFQNNILDVNDILQHESNLANLPIINQPDNLAYVIYTSGTTGAPKGVLVTHKNVVRLVKNTNYVEFNSGDRILQTGALEFDASTFEVWGSLLNNMCLVLARKDDLLYPDTLKSIIKNSNISTMWMTSSYFNRMLDEDSTIFEPLKNLLIGGEALSLTHVNKIREIYPELNLINGYGPTENVTFSTTLLINKKYESSVPIGKPISNSTAYIVDRNNSLVPIGVSGELLVGGDGVSRGYLNNEELTKEKFIPNIFTSEGVLYRTGDSARWLADGNIEFLGRIDSQVKIRGYRIELSEIENQILKYDSIIESVVIDLESADRVKYLCAYYITDDKSDNLGTELKEFISHFLPDYMIPACFIKIAKVPLTSNGKLDKKSLPAPEAKVSYDFIAPRTEIENKLAEIWSEVLDIELDKIGINSNFFDLGGHSLKAVNLASKVYKEFEVKIPLIDIFKNQNLNKLALLISKSSNQKYISISKSEPKEYYPLSSAQKRLFVLQQMNLDNTNYNMPMILPVEENINLDKLKFTFNKLIERHESLRTSFHIIDEEPFQKIHEEVDFKIEEVILNEAEFKELSENFSIPFDLSKAPLIRVKFAEVNNNESYLLVDMHHIITDGTSQNILEEEFSQIYNGDELPDLRLQYTDYSEWQNSKEQQHEMHKQEKFWLEKFNDELPILNLPYDFKRPEVQSFEGASVDFVLDKNKTKIIEEISRATNSSLYMVLLSVYNILLYKISSEPDIIIGTPVQGRKHSDLEKIIGVFINTLAIRTQISYSMNYLDIMKDIKSNVLSCFENQEYQFEDFVEKLNINRDTSRNPIFDVMFNFLNIDSSNSTINEDEYQDLQHYKSDSKFDLDLSGSKVGDLILLNLNYCTKLFKSDTINRFVSYFKKIIDELSISVDFTVSGIDILSNEEKNQLLYNLNNTGSDYPKNKTINQLFEEQVAKTPENESLVFESSRLTYKELNKRSNQLAGFLLNKGVNSNVLVGLLFERSFEMAVGILAVLKAGGTYLPLDTAHPEERVKGILNTSNCKFLLSNLNTLEIDNIEIIDINNSLNYSSDSSNPDILNSSTDLAYIIYTSGTTGVPKGVMIEHQSIVNFVYGINEHIPFTTEDSLLSLTTISFDIFGLELFSSLLNGVKVVIGSDAEQLDPGLILQKIKDENISILQLTPSRLQLLLAAKKNRY